MTPNPYGPTFLAWACSKEGKGWYLSHSRSCLLSFRNPCGERGKLGYPRRLLPFISAVRAPSCSPHRPSSSRPLSDKDTPTVP